MIYHQTTPYMTMSIMINDFAYKIYGWMVYDNFDKCSHDNKHSIYIQLHML